MHIAKSPQEVQLWSVIPYAIATPTTVLVAFISDRTKLRGTIMLFTLPVVIVGYAVIANINSRNQIVLSGSLQRIRQLLVQIREFGGHDPRAVEIKSDSPFHNPIMKPAADYMRKVLSTTNIQFPAYMPCVSNVSGRPFESKEDLVELLSGQAVRTVRWWDSIKYLDQEAGVKRWLGVGPGKVGRNLVGKEVGKVQSKTGGVWAITDPRELETVLNEFLDKEAAH